MTWTLLAMSLIALMAAGFAAWLFGVLTDLFDWME